MNKDNNNNINKIIEVYKSISNINFISENINNKTRWPNGNGPMLMAQCQ